MNILFHCGVGNTDRPARWNAICSFFSDLARSLEALDNHNCLIYCHPAAVSKDIYKQHIISSTVNKIEFVPDIIFTWNGISDGDQQMISLYGRDRFIFAELGFFDHYNTCYFDRSGTNYTSMSLVENLSSNDIDYNLYEKIKSLYVKPRLFDNRYVFVPLQDESDTQITKLSPFKTMYELLDYVLCLYNFDSDIKILYKQHPRKPSRVPIHNKLVSVSEDVHHYLPYADSVIGINSTVLFETLLYHQRLLTVGIGVASRRFNSDAARVNFINTCHKRQLRLTDLSKPDVIKRSWLYKNL